MATKIDLFEGRKIGDYRGTDDIDKPVYSDAPKKRGYLSKIPLIGTVVLSGFGISTVGDILGEPDYGQLAERRENKADSAYVTNAQSAKIDFSEVLKAVQMSRAEAQENGTRKVYIDRFVIGGDIPAGKYQNADQTIPRELAKILKRNKINVITDRRLIDDKTIVISGTLVYTANDRSMPPISDGSPHFWDSIKITVDYDNPDYLMDSNELKLEWSAYPDPMLHKLGTGVSDYLGQIFAMEAESERARPQSASKGAPDEIREGNVVWKKAIGLGENAKKHILEKNQKAIDMFKRTGIEIKYIDNEFYYRKLN